MNEVDLGYYQAVAATHEGGTPCRYCSVEEGRRSCAVFESAKNVCELFAGWTYSRDKARALEQAISHLQAKLEDSQTEVILWKAKAGQLKAEKRLVKSICKIKHMQLGEPVPAFSKIEEK